MQRVALLGLGAMGAGMAANWLSKEFPLTIYNRTRASAERLAAAQTSPIRRERRPRMQT